MLPDVPWREADDGGRRLGHAEDGVSEAVELGHVQLPGAADGCPVFAPWKKMPWFDVIINVLSMEPNMNEHFQTQTSDLSFLVNGFF